MWNDFPRFCLRSCALTQFLQSELLKEPNYQKANFCHVRGWLQFSFPTVCGVCSVLLQIILRKGKCPSERKLKLLHEQIL